MAIISCASQPQQESKMAWPREIISSDTGANSVSSLSHITILPLGTSCLFERDDTKNISAHLTYRAGGLARQTCCLIHSSPFSSSLFFTLSCHGVGQASHRLTPHASPYASRLTRRHFPPLSTSHYRLVAL
ncbi:hypothetical protein BN1723_009484 [Verticillium longisporum]|uniref:Uncharacterized protein n=1 Tax=Verticillium longisporum TaxID=100787 RepID=A0A0G4KPK0_VERLO|nr:hypothetical protein BN1723_009484 [Verticillium longisporum]